MVASSKNCELPRGSAALAQNRLNCSALSAVLLIAPFVFHGS
jgi:hypothetical protein